MGGLSALVDPARHFAQLYSVALPLDQPLARFFYQCTWINVIAWGCGYLLAAYQPAQRLPILAAGAAGKTAYFLAGLTLFQAEIGNQLFLGTAVFDLLLAGCFIAILCQRKPEQPRRAISD